MVLEIVKYGHPALRERGEKIRQIDQTVRALAADMLETMRDAQGVGLAAQQVGRALQLFVVDVGEVEDRPSTLEIGGQLVSLEAHMPMVLINTEVQPLGEPETGPEGCLSFPEIYADITRPRQVQVQALNEEGDPVRFCCGGLLARAIQHEHDHTRGILFIDRMPRSVKTELQAELDALHAATKASLRPR
ncbi:MAG: peptide deformylase [Verrucomicrobiales bacterium]|nr:peptide deformylase [Verrucomicrobiales bacterium]MCP5525670.1 peptide deformylase [Verrucomicrobiales bacterium]